jgi:hypothetical protein
VVEGSHPQQFEVEVLGVLDSMDPGVQPILVSLSGIGLEQTGVIAGMSGSPVYVGGELIGAVAFAWPFAKLPLAGVTPITAMREIVLRPPPTRKPSVKKAVAWRELLAPREPVETRWQRRLRSIPGFERPETSGAWQLVGAGFGPHAVETLSRAFSPHFAVLPSFPVVSSASPSGHGGFGQGGSRELLGGDLVPGSAVAQVWIDGDLQLAATGTVTERSGERVLAFGHAVLGLGSVEIPMAPAEVIAVLPSSLFSFKLSRIGKPLGRFEVDHLAGAVGRLGVAAATTPLDLVVQGAAIERRFRLQLARVPQLLPFLGAIGLYGALDVALSAGGIESLDLGVELDLGGGGALSIKQVFDGEGAGLQGALFLADLLEYLVQNELGTVEVRQIRVQVQAYPEPRRAKLLAASASASRVHPGETVVLRSQLLPVRGEPKEVEVRFEVPQDLPEGRWSLLVGDGWSVEQVRQTLVPFEPRSLEEVIELLRELPSQKELVVLGFSSEPTGLGPEGALPRMPPSLRWLRSGLGSGAARLLRASLVQEDVFEMEDPVEGLVRVDLVVDRREHFPAGALEPEKRSSGGRR